MDQSVIMGTSDQALALRLSELRLRQGWSLDDLAARTGISRATLSRIERAETSPTASLMGKLATAYGLTMSRLLAGVEGQAPQLVRADQALVWIDPETQFVRRSVSPPAEGFETELVLGELPAGARINYAAPAIPGLEEHLFVLSGCLNLTVEGDAHSLRPEDCLRFRLFGTTQFHNPGPSRVRYLIAITQP